MLKLKRAYDSASKADGTRILVERLWPRDLSNEQVHVGTWLKEVRPGTDLRKWFGHGNSLVPSWLPRVRVC
jgi:uncharacterized protein YeaO (DUF488 family)